MPEQETDKKGCPFWAGKNLIPVVGIGGAILLGVYVLVHAI